MAAQATVALEKAKKLEPDKASIREALGIAYFRIQRWKEAEAEFRAVLELSPTDDYAHYALGRALEKQGRDAEANGHYKLASSLSPIERALRRADHGARRARPRTRPASYIRRSPVTRWISSSEVTPASAEADPVLAQGDHPAARPRRRRSPRSSASIRLPDLAADRHHLVERDAAAVAGVRALGAAARRGRAWRRRRSSTPSSPSAIVSACVGHVRPRGSGRRAGARAAARRCS